MYFNAVPQVNETAYIFCDVAWFVFILFKLHMFMFRRREVTEQVKSVIILDMYK